MFNTFKNRSQETEIIDDFSLSGPEIENTFKSIERVNIWLGGNQVFVNSLKKIVENKSIQLPVKNWVLYDLGCGIGDGLTALANWARKKNIKMQFKGLDANPYVVELAKKRNVQWSEISFKEQNIFGKDYSLEGVDIVSFNLCLHHFEEKEIASLLEKCKNAQVKAVLINDLHRHWLAYYLFALLTWIIRMPYTPREDGLLSIRKGFKKQELAALANQFAPHFSLKWKWAFRYQLILYL